jgi:hypothetical protein
MKELMVRIHNNTLFAKNREWESEQLFAELPRGWDVNLSQSLVGLLYESAVEKGKALTESESFMILSIGSKQLDYEYMDIMEGNR